MAGITGHSLCMDYFGLPSSEEASLGLSLHGEAPNSRWQIIRRYTNPARARIKLSVRLPAAGLRLVREIGMQPDESIVYFKETVTNTGKADHFFHWTQHISLGPPFINNEDSRIVLPGARGLTFPHGYDEGKASLRSGRTFRWPNAPGVTNKSVDLRRPFSLPGSGFVAGVLLEKGKNTGFVAALNRKERSLIGYCFSRSDFPWVTIWEENRAIQAVPRRGRAPKICLSDVRCARITRIHSIEDLQPT